MKRATFFQRYIFQIPTIAFCLVGFYFSVLALAGCNKEEVAAQPAGQPVAQSQTDVADIATQAEDDKMDSEEKDTLQKAAELLEKAKSSGGDGAKQATEWMQQFLGDAAESSGETAQETMDWANDMYQSMKKQGLTTAGSATEWLSEDWNRIGAWEYKVIVVDDLSPSELEKKLNEMGAQRWECFHVSSTADGQTMYFKKHARSYLKHVPLKDMMKLIPLLDSGGE